MIRPGKILLVAYHFPPLSSVGYKRPLRLANHFAKTGWEVVVFSGNPATQPSFSGIDPQLLDRLHPDIRVVRPWALHGIEWLFRMLGRGKHTATLSSQTPFEDGGKRPVWKKWIDVLEHLICTPDRFNSWILFSLPGLICEVIRKRPVAVYATGPPWSPLIASVLTGILFGIPITLDYRDPWHENAYVDTSSLTLRLERGLVGRAQTVITTTLSMAELMGARFLDKKEKVSCVYNGYDPEELRFIEETSRTQTKDPAQFVVAHVGTLYARRLPPELAKALAEAAASWNHDRALRFSFLGWIEEPGILEAAFSGAGALGRLELLGRVSANEAVRKQVAADALLLLQPGANVQLPAKLFEYALTGNPILCYAPKDSEAARIVAGYDLGVVVTPEEIGAFGTRIQELVVAPRNPERIAFLNDFNGERLAEAMANLILRGPPQA